MPQFVSVDFFVFPLKFPTILIDFNEIGRIFFSLGYDTVLSSRATDDWDAKFQRLWLQDPQFLWGSKIICL